MASRKVLILEDDPNRVERFLTVLNELDDTLECVLWRNAFTMIQELPAHIEDAVLISLDNDLDSVDHGDDNSVDPGEGWHVAEFLATQSPVAPVIVHTTNVGAAETMMFWLERSGWNVNRVGPIGDDWIEVDWKREVQRLGIA